MSRAAMQQALEALMKSHTHPLLPDDCEEAITALRAALAEPEQEPVAWRYRGNLHEFDPSDWAEGPVTPLYTAPTPRRPLTDAEIRGLADKHLFYQPEGYEVSGIFNFARAIERAHGIGGQHGS